jgi:membrane-bound lytic murein transglycosylase D
LVHQLNFREYNELPALKDGLFKGNNVKLGRSQTLNQFIFVIFAIQKKYHLPMSVKNFSFVFFLFLSYPSLMPEADPIPYDEEGIIARLSSMNTEVIKARYDVAVKSYLKTYTVRGRRSAERILGKQLLYFPMIENYLKEAGLPEELKYLSIVESALEPRARSHAGAVGLWQFMAPTGRFYGLRIDNYVDERCDPAASTQAAIKYLKDLYRQFGSWELAIAAYNSGSGRVIRAVKRGSSTDYWEIRNHLPKETANYVPGFIAANYLSTFAEAHGLEPDFPPLDLQLTQKIKIFRAISFETIAKITGLSLETIELLNPTFRKSMIPASENGFDLLLPRRVGNIVYQWLQTPLPEADKMAAIASNPVFTELPKDKMDAPYQKTVYFTHHGETLEELSMAFKCDVAQLKAWNKLKDSSLEYCQPITVYHPDDVFIEQDRPGGPIVKAIDNSEMPGELGKSDLSLRFTNEEAKVREEEFISYKIKRPESLFEIAMKLEGVSFSDLLQWNGFDRNFILRPGRIIKVKKTK